MQKVRGSSPLSSTGDYEGGAYTNKRYGFALIVTFSLSSRGYSGLVRQTATSGGDKEVGTTWTVTYHRKGVPVYLGYKHREPSLKN